MISVNSPRLNFLTPLTKAIDQLEMRAYVLILHLFPDGLLKSRRDVSAEAVQICGRQGKQNAKIDKVLSSEC